jgi:outer membrane protein assembly factor BamA
LNAILTQRSTIDPEVSAGLMFRGWTTPDSAAFFKATIGSGINIYGEYFQPFGAFSRVPWLRFDTDYDDWILQDLKVSTLYRTYGGGVWLEYAISNHQDARLGISLESIKESSILDSEPQSEGSELLTRSARLVAVRAAYRFDNRSSVVFPGSGQYFLAYASWGSPPLGSELGFFKLEADYEFAKPIGYDTTLGVAAFAGTDFAGIIPGAAKVTGARYFSLARQGMFYGMTAGEPQGTGDTVAAVGLELRHRVGKINPVLGGDFYGIANFSLGTTDWYGEDTVNYLPLRWSGTIGAGAKLTNQLGGFAGVGLVGSAGTLRPALTLLIGSFEDAIEDRR